jgi:hypothetical protein
MKAVVGAPRAATRGSEFRKLISTRSTGFLRIVLSKNPHGSIPWLPSKWQALDVATGAGQYLQREHHALR